RAQPEAGSNAGVGADPEPARQVWVLGASLGGPPALKQFFNVLPAGLPVCFVLAQHIGGGFVKLFADQLNRSSAVEVMLAHDGRLVRHGEVLLVPVGERFSVDKDGRVALLPEKRHRLYRPSIDDVLQTVADRYGAAAGAIIFSGMGADGARGCVDLAEVGGTVWAQDAESCIISSMPDAARRTGAVNFSGTPEMLAQRVTEFVAE
ncbi:MAG: chemotaxis protein CheB, partial [Gammaproteobacteria bacterium]